jgi:lipid-binding SYLF domain-containing protein
MKLRSILAAVAAAAIAFTSTAALAQSDKEKKQAEVRARTQAALNDFYKANPKLKDQIAKAPGYAVFSTYGFTFLLGGAGGKGLVHDNKTKHDTYMDLAQASAGLQVGASDTRYLFVFKDAASMQRFIASGWEAGAEGGATGGTGKKTAGGTGGQFTGGEVYSLSKLGFQAGGAVAGTKVWRDKELN